MSSKSIRQYRVFTDASHHPASRIKQKHARSGGGIILVNPKGEIERAFLINYNHLNLPSSSASEMLTMTIAAEHFAHLAVSISGDSTGDVDRVRKFVSVKNKFNTSSVMPDSIKKRLHAMDGQLKHIDFRYMPRENKYMRAVDLLAEMAEALSPGILYEVPVVNGRISHNAIHARKIISPEAASSAPTAALELAA